MRAFWRGFTLAEVLITLTIIGIIAALTIPSLMTKVQDHGFRSAFLKAYQVVQNAHKMANRDGINFWDNNDNWLNEDLKNDINLIKDYFKVSNKQVQKAGGGAGVAVINTFYDRNEWNAAHIKFLNDSAGTSHWAFFQNAYALAFQTQDGMIIAFCLFNYLPRMIYIDVNGPNKPNIVGKDIFFLQAIFNSNDGSFSIYPWGSPFTRYAHGVRADDDCYKNSTGASCGYQILKNKGFVIPDKKPE